MDINKCAAEILEKNLKSYREVYYVSRIRLKNLIKRYIWQKECRIGVFGYKRDVKRFIKCLPGKNDNVICEYAKPEDWIKKPGIEFDNEELMFKISKLPIDKLIIVSENLRYLLQMYLICEEVPYEIVDVYDLIKREFSQVLVKSIANTPWEIMKECIIGGGLLLSERFAVFREIKYIKSWRKDKKIVICDNYDGILVKRYLARKAQDNKQKMYYLQELIINYLMIKDFENAFFYIDNYINLFGKEDNRFFNIKNQFIELFSQMKKQLSDRTKKDIIVFWCDALPYSDFKAWHFLEELGKDSLMFENAYTHVPHTHTTSQSMFTGLPYFDAGLYHTLESEVMIQQGKTLDLLEDNHYNICEIGANYIHKKYTIKLSCAIKDSYPPATVHLWETLAQLLKDEDQKKFMICHMDCELHSPFWNGISDKLRIDSGNPLTDISDFYIQRKESADYLQNQILYYLDFFGDKSCKIFMSDHGIGGPAYSESRLHAFCFVKDLYVAKGNYKKYFSYLNFYDLINYILNPTENNFNNIFSDYVLIQNDHPYGEKFCNIILSKIKNGEDLEWKEWMGFRGIIKSGYKFIRFPDFREIWFDSKDKEIEPEEISDQSLVQFMRNTVGNEFPDIYADEHYTNTRELFEKLHLDYQGMGAVWRHS